MAAIALLLSLSAAAQKGERSSLSVSSRFTETGYNAILSVDDRKLDSDPADLCNRLVRSPPSRGRVSEVLSSYFQCRSVRDQLTGAPALLLSDLSEQGI